jgi:oxygen-dependent protoporphyrinogen oxidase
MESKRIIVVGAGIAGLTAAYRLKLAGHDVEVFERRHNVGGRMITIEWQGLKIDPGAEFLTGADKYLLEMVDLLGIDDKLIDYSEEQTGFDVSVMRDGSVHSVNFMSIVSYMSWTAVSLKARLSMLKLLPYLIRYGRSNVYDPAHAPGDDGTTMEQFFYEKINDEMFEYWVEPTMDVFCGYTPTDLSSKMLLLMFGSYLGQKLYTFEDGIGFLPDTLASRLNVNCGSEVRSVEAHEDGCGVKVSVIVNGQTRNLDADSVIIAVPGDSVLGLFKNPLPSWQSFFGEVDYTRVGIVYHLVDDDNPIFDEGGIMFPRKEPWYLSALGWKRRKDGRTLAMSDLKAHLYDPKISSEELIKTITTEVIRAVPEFEDRIIDQMVYLWPRKVPTFRVGYLSALKTFIDDPGENPIYFCGDYLIGPSAGSALASGWHCVDRLLEQM